MGFPKALDTFLGVLILISIVVLWDPHWGLCIGKLPNISVHQTSLYKDYLTCSRVRYSARACRVNYAAFFLLFFSHRGPVWGYRVSVFREAVRPPAKSRRTLGILLKPNPQILHLKP